MLKHFAAAAIVTGLAVATAAQRPTAAWVDARFHDADRNRDGQLSSAELARAAARVQPAARLRPAERQRLVTRATALLDTDRDGRVSLAEARRGAATYAARFDRNGDHRLDATERRAAEAFLRGRG